MENQDRILHFTLAGGAVRGLLIQSTETVREAQRLHAASAVAAAALGRALTGTAMLASTLKEPNASVTLTIDGTGPLGKLVCVGDGETVRGYVEHMNSSVPLRDGRLDVGCAVGHSGRLSVVKDLRLKSPYIGQIELTSGEIAADLAYYYVQSEQSPSLVSLGVIASDSGVAAAGGVLLQPLPGCPAGVIEPLEMRSPIFGDIAAELRHETPETLLARWFDGLSPVLLETRALRYRCPCSRRRMERALISLGTEELSRMIADEVEGAELVCHFCNEKYQFTTHDLLRLLNRIR
ncbi:MAG: Hsp33 family molecular chaperone HslO [Clostridiales bacterium]|nr:Hsp33 family molecular chaperone HslO [Clostridiales bacterium]